MFPVNQTKNGQHNRPGFTLMELLLVITIMAVMATMSLGVMRSAQEDAREAATRSRILQIESMLQMELENYEVRRLPISLSTLKADYTGTDLIKLRDLKRQILADMISAEMPRPLLSGSTFATNPDLGKFPTEQPSIGAPTGYDSGFAQWLDDNHSGLRVVLAKLKPATVRHFSKFNGNASFNLPGEYLYEILSRIDFEGVSGVESLGNAAIGNSDDDGNVVYPEVLDAWGQPLQLRILQVDATETSPGVWQDQVTDWTNRDPNTLIPQGYVPLNPSIPRSIHQIRFQVVSTSMGLGQ